VANAMMWVVWAMLRFGSDLLFLVCGHGSTSRARAARRCAVQPLC
jgi:hypothetical protein